MKVTSTAVSNALFVIACLVVITVGGLELRERWNRESGPQFPPAIQKIGGLTVNLSEATIRTHGTPRVVLVEFSDFECPYSGRYAREVSPQIWRDFVESGLVAHAFFSFPLERIHPTAMRASEAAECAGRQGRFWEMYDLLFRSQHPFEDPLLIDHARELPLVTSDFQGCLEADVMRPRIRAQIDIGRRVGVMSTPTFFVGWLEGANEVRAAYRIHGAQSYSVFSDALKELTRSQPR